MLVIKPHIFSHFPEIVFGFSTKTGMGRKHPYYFNMSYSVGDNKSLVDENRKYFFNSLGLNVQSVAFQKQVHKDNITEVNIAGFCGESDALITDKLNLGLVISSADCPAIFIYDTKSKIIAAVHSGWRGTEKKILKKTVVKLKNDYNSDPGDLICYIGPSISQPNYEVGKEVAESFDDMYIQIKKESYFLDLKKANYDMLISENIPVENIQVSKLCSFGYSDLLHSYRRDGEKSGRASGLIAMKETE